MPRQFFVGGNFKMNPCSRQDKKKIVDVLNGADLDPSTEVMIAPPALYILPLQHLLRKDVKLGAQNCHPERSGAYTGEISPVQLADAGIPYVIIGHSERRTLFGETSELVAKKTHAALRAGLAVVLCVGETLAEREAGVTMRVVKDQLNAVVNELTVDDWSRVVIAYEPVWAIGTGKVATTAQAQEVHRDIREHLATVSPLVAEHTRIIYGGSVTAANCRDLAKEPDVDGFLVGGASLKPEFVNIVNARK